MTLNAISIHQYQVSDDQTRLRQPPEPRLVDGLAQDLCQALKLAFIGKAGKQFGHFNDDLSVSILRAWINDYTEGKQSFHSLASRFAVHLQLAMVQTDCLFDGFLLLLHETLADEDALYIYLLQHEGGICVDGELGLAQSHNLDVRGLRAGVRISLSELGAGGTEPALALLRARGDKPLAEAFEQGLGFVDPVDNSAQTTAFLQLVNQYTANLAGEQAQVTRKKVADFCIEQDRQGRAVEISSISQEINDAEPAAFERFIFSAAPEAPVQFYADRKQVRQFVRISGRTDQMSLSFSSECLGQTVVYDASSDTLMLKEIPPALKARLIKFVTEQRQAGDQ